MTAIKMVKPDFST